MIDIIIYGATIAEYVVKKIIVFLRIFYFQDSFLNIRIGHFLNVQF
jgi:hypothetical protein